MFYFVLVSVLFIHIHLCVKCFLTIFRFQSPRGSIPRRERIIGGRKVANEEKILSLYESDLHVIVRGKVRAELDFGNSLFLAENADGFILDHELKREISEGDAKWLQARYAGMKESTQTGKTIWRLIPVPAILPGNEAIRPGEIFSSLDTKERSTTHRLGRRTNPFFASSSLTTIRDRHGRY